MDLSAEAIDRIRELTERARDSEQFDFQYSGSHVRIENQKTGAVRWDDVPVSPLKSTVLTIDDLIAVTSRWDDGGTAEVSIWVNSQSVTAVLGSHRDGSVRLPLKLNPAFNVLQNLRVLDPKTLIRKLKVDLFQCTTDIDLKSALSNLKFEVNSTTESTNRKNDESIAKSVRAKVTGESDIPDEVVFTFQAFPEHFAVIGGIRVACAVVTEPDKGTVSVLPYPGEIDSAINEAVRELAVHIRSLSDDTSVYCGSCG